jgi:carotenoid cleavage dioxygenase-like enzyme
MPYYLSSSCMCSDSTLLKGYLRLDLETGKKQEWLAPMHTYCEEVVVVQKKRNKKERKEIEIEDDVWVLGSMFDAVKNKACVGIFDGRDISKGLPWVDVM